MPASARRRPLRPNHAAAAAGVMLLAGIAPAGHGAPASPDLEHGRATFLYRCAVCHGEEADGTGRMASILTPPPANLQISVLDDAGRNAIVRGGGASVGRSAAMPRWELELDERDLRDVIGYVAELQRLHRRRLPTR